MWVIACDYARGQLLPKTGCGRMNIGMGYERWHDVLENLLHESFEMALIQVGGRFAKEPDFSQSTGGFLFSLDHEQFQEVVARCAEFLSKAIPDLQRAFNAKRRGHAK